MRVSSLGAAAALHEKCDIFQAGACTGGSPTVEDALHPLLLRQDEGLDVVVGRRWQTVARTDLLGASP